MESIKVNFSNHKPYNIASTITEIEGRMVMLTYYKNTETGEQGSEVYTGENYIPNDTNRSYSRNYKEGKGLPKKYIAMVQFLQDMYNMNFSN